MDAYLILVKLNGVKTGWEKFYRGDLRGAKLIASKKLKTLAEKYDIFILDIKNNERVVAYKKSTDKVWSS